jgi:uncharacterized protein
VHLNLHVPDTPYYVRRVAPHAVTVVDRELHASFILATDRLVEAWDASDVSSLTPASADPILELEPAVVLLGSGAKLRFPPQAVLAAFLTRGIGVEVMDNAAAARTFNVLAQEGRKVVAAFILP